MTGVTVALLGAAEIAKELGKKGTSSDLTLFNRVHDEHAITNVEPTQFPEKIPPLLTAIAMADRCLLVVPELSRPVAETIAVLELTEVPTTVVVGSGVGDSEVARVLKGGRLADAPRVPLDLPHLRELVESWVVPAREGPVRVPIDHAFPVKGVGAVALGVVRRGTLRAHDRLHLFPTPRAVEIRSMQVHDVDRKEAGVGERVGVALKGVEADELARGQVLAPDGSLEVASTLRFGPLARCRYYRGDAGPGARLHLSLDLQSVPVALDELSRTETQLTSDRPVVVAPQEPAYLLDLDVPAGPRIFGRVVTSGSSATRSGP